MRYIVLKDGAEVNRIAASEGFIQNYCSENGYTYQLIEEQDDVPVDTVVEDPETALLELSAEHEERLCMLELTMM